MTRDSPRPLPLTPSGAARSLPSPPARPSPGPAATGHLLGKGGRCRGIPTLSLRVWGPPLRPGLAGGAGRGARGGPRRPLRPAPGMFPLCPLTCRDNGGQGCPCGVGGRRAIKRSPCSPQTRPFWAARGGEGARRSPDGAAGERERAAPTEPSPGRAKVRGSHPPHRAGLLYLRTRRFGKQRRPQTLRAKIRFSPHGKAFTGSSLIAVISDTKQIKKKLKIEFKAPLN